jgi:hypothetical protein
MLDGWPEPSRPAFLRGDCAWGTERAMEGAEQRKIVYLFKLKQTAHVKKLIGKMLGQPEWLDAEQNWQGLESELQLSGWTKKRRVVLLRRRGEGTKGRPTTESGFTRGELSGSAL